MAKKPKQNTVVFGALVLTHGRADNVRTVETLRKFGYTGAVKLLVDNEDEQVEQYREAFGSDNVVVFDKAESAKNVDTMDNAGHLRGVVYARNASFEIARSLGWTHFIMLDDDYIDWRWIWGSDCKYHHPTIKSLDRVFGALVEFMVSTPAKTIALAQAGDLMGGQASSGNTKTINIGSNGRRKAMNTFVCSVDRPFRFAGRINEDVNAYVLLGSRGDLFFQSNHARITQYQTQTNAGGLTEIYRDQGTYVKSFFSVICSPSCVRVQTLHSKFVRLHHRISWRHAVPKILKKEVRKSK